MKNYLNQWRFRRGTTKVVGGEFCMAEFIWHWTKENKKIYTTQVDVAEQALKDGFFVMGARINPYPSQL